MKMIDKLFSKRGKNPGSGRTHLLREYNLETIKLA